MGKNQKLSHSECRGRVCIFCFKKGEKGRKLPQNFKLHFELLKGQLEFSLDDLTTPSGLCACCRKLYSNGFSAKHFLHKNFDFVVLPNSFSEQCFCSICKVARESNFSVQHDPGRPRISPLYRSATLHVKPTTSEERTVPKTKICLRCQTTIAAWKFKDHICTNQVLVENVVSLPFKPKSNTSRSTVVQEIASASIKEQDPSPKGTIRLAQAKGGRKLSLTLGSAKVKSPKQKISSEKLLSLRKSGDFTERGMKRIGGFINKRFKKGSIEPKYQQIIREANKQFDTHLEECSIVVKGKSYALIYVRDLSEYMLEVCRF